MEICYRLVQRTLSRPGTTPHRKIYSEYLRTMNIVFFLFFITETYNMFAHAFVLFRIRLLPRKDTVRLRFYFIFEVCSVICTSFFVLQRFRWLVCIHALQHLYYFSLWEKTGSNKKVLSWSSIDWTHSKYNANYEWSFILGTAFDFGVHVTFSHFLKENLTGGEAILGTLICLTMVYFVFFSNRYAWSNPHKPPAWVGKRVQPVELYWKEQ